MLKLLAWLLLAPMAGSVAAQRATQLVAMSNFKFAPPQIVLVANKRVVLELRNESSGGHSFIARQFFAAAHVDPASARSIQAGRVEVPSHQTVTLSLVPAAGQYPLKCSHTLHSAFGMKGVIVVR